MNAFIFAVNVLFKKKMNVNLNAFILLDNERERERGLVNVPNTEFFILKRIQYFILQIFVKCGL